MYRTLGISQLSFEEALLLRREFIPESSCLHFAKSPVCIERGKGQYLFDDKNCRYLDCFSSYSPVGHSHPEVVEVGRRVLSSFLSRNPAQFRRDEVVPRKRSKRTSYGDFDTPNEISALTERLYDELRKRLPPHYDTIYFAKSGAEANDIAVFLARAYTKGEETLVVDESHHGDLSTIAALSARMFHRHKLIPEKWVHVLPVPVKDSPDMLAEAKKKIADLKSQNRKLCCLLCEPIFGLAGGFIPTSSCMHSVVELVRENGGLWIADEILTGLGRLGTHFWGFELLNSASDRKCYPDILTVGKPLGNGFPISLVITSSKIASAAGDALNQLKKPPLESAIGAVVLGIIDRDKMMESVAKVGAGLKAKLISRTRKHHILGDVRGQGLLVSVDVVTDKESRMCNKVDALHLWYLLKERGVLCCLEGPERSSLMLQPPLCFTAEDGEEFVDALCGSVEAMRMAYAPKTDLRFSQFGDGGSSCGTSCSFEDRPLPLKSRVIEDFEELD
ncbi:unnamed protein product [Notodromas monacha]|uniref:Uncharacterized protein n=1 Tax=Notodromas monacha TaxID=399045 RepID=A0A7R9GCR9_9CRUS|nr:unnamed protein product [Notodromas monacha]CAG0917752.1 unnamed protein product [Notodromas monacha]